MRALPAHAGSLCELRVGASSPSLQVVIPPFLAGAKNSFRLVVASCIEREGEISIIDSSVMCVYVYVYVGVCACMCVCVCVGVRVYACMRVFVSMCVYACMYMCASVCNAM